MLKVSSVAKSYGPREVVSDVSFTVAHGETFGLIGGNGAGKSTVMNVISGLLPPDAGTVTIAGDSPGGGNAHHLGVAMQEIALYPTLTCEENLLFFGKLYRMHGNALRTAVKRTIERAGLEPYAGAKAATLSGGWQRRLNLAVALVHAPRLLLLDEPSVGLDVDGRLALWDLIRELREEGAAILLTTHLMEEAEQLCDRLAIIVNGAIVAQGTLEELRTHVPARELAIIECDDQLALCRAADRHELGLRHYAGQPTLLLPERTTISNLAQLLGDIGLRSVTLTPVGLLHIYLELTGHGGAELLSGDASEEGKPL